MPPVEEGVDALYALVRKHPGAFKVVEPVLRRLDWGADVGPLREAMIERLNSCVPAETTGFYLGLDGVNMPGGKGIEMGCSSGWEAGEETINYVYGCDTYCDELPMRSLAAYYTWYYVGNVGLEALRGQDSLAIEYPVCLGASALVMAHALRGIEPAVLCGSKAERCFAFGFHDGDMMRLGRATRKGFVCEATFDCW
jgi:hypothetical protein